MATTEALSEARRRSTRLLRRTIPARIGGRKSFASITSNWGGAAPRSGARVRATCRIVPLPIPAAEPSGFSARAFLDRATPGRPLEAGAETRRERDGPQTHLRRIL